MSATSKDDTFNMVKWTEGFLDMLECPVCLEVMLKPIYICRNGHNVCGVCKTKIHKCPTCRSVLTSTRNIFAENTAEKFLVLCKYKYNGCKIKIQCDKIEDHEAYCPYQPTECLLGGGTNAINKCGWVGKKSLLLKHAKTCTNNAGRYVLVTCPIKKPAYEYDFASNYVEVNLIHRDNELFWLLIKYDAAERKHYEAVQCIGSQEIASQYQYEHTLHSIDGEQHIVTNFITTSIYEDIESVFSSGKCLILDHSVFRHYFCNIYPANTLTIRKTL